jgi:hypothetical protein
MSNLKKPDKHMDLQLNVSINFTFPNANGVCPNVPCVREARMRKRNGRDGDFRIPSQLVTSVCLSRLSSRNGAMRMAVGSVVAEIAAGGK